MDEELKRLHKNLDFLEQIIEKMADIARKKGQKK